MTLLDTGGSVLPPKRTAPPHWGYCTSFPGVLSDL